MTNTEEQAYLDLVKKIIEEGSFKIDRTKVGTYSIFGASMRFSLRNNKFPLLTTKKTAIGSIMKELIFFIRGQTDNKILTDQNCHIWTGNSTKEFFEANNIHREPGDLGPIYGFQWRHYGAEYTTSSADYSNKGIDQLQNVINEIKNNPNSRRMVVVAWNPKDLPQMALPPCHCLFQFNVADGYLNCILYQRSGDMGLGIPFNIASYSLLTIMIAYITGLKPGEFVHFIGDAHVYKNHVEPLKEQLSRSPYEFPEIYVKPRRTIAKIDDFEIEDFEIKNYKSHDKIFMEMAV